jgi:excisionase family DNA binding protein
MSSNLLSIEEGAGFLNIKASTVRAWILSRRIPFVKLGRRVFLRKTDLEKLIADSVVLPKDASK